MDSVLVLDRAGLHIVPGQPKDFSIGQRRMVGIDHERRGPLVRFVV